MKSTEALRVLADPTASQWGMVTSAQAGALGISRLTLARLSEAGHLTRLSHGVYKDSGTPQDHLEDLRAAWLSTQPKVMADQRLKDGVGGVVVAGASASALHGIGDLWAARHEFVSSIRRQSQRPDMRHRRRTLDPRDLTVVEGLPTMSVERTIADLLEDTGDLSLVADALRDAALRRTVDQGRLADLLSPLASRNGLARCDGVGLLNRLFEAAEIDVDAVARRIAADSELSSRVVANYFARLSTAQLNRLIATPARQQSMDAIHESIAKVLSESVPPSLARLDVSATASIDRMVASGAFERFATRLAANLPTPDVGNLVNLSTTSGTPKDLTDA